MFKCLQPDESFKSIYDIDLKKIWSTGFRYIIVDVDNTITSWKEYVTTPKLLDWFSNAKDTGFGVCLLSNSSQREIARFAEELDVLAATKSGKPFKKAFNSALAVLDGKKEETVVIGDQIFTDILGGNKAGLYTILVDPIDPNEFIFTKINRFFEKLIVGR